MSAAHPDYDGHEFVAFSRDERRGFHAVLVVHNTRLGPALGGVRIHAYASEAAALGDALRLSRATACVAAVSGLPIGGAKAVIIDSDRGVDREDQMAAMAQFLDSLNGAFTAMRGYGLDASEFDQLAARTDHVVRPARVEGVSSPFDDPAYATAYGVFRGLAVSVACRLNRKLADVSVTIVGAGAVGYRLASLLARAGTRLFVADMDARRLDRVVSEFDATAVSINEVFDTPADVLAPCADGEQITERDVSRIRARVVAGSAFNQLANDGAGVALAVRNILYAPDFVVNAGGMIHDYYAMIGEQDPHVIRRRIERIERTLVDIFRQSRERGVPTHRIAGNMARAAMTHASRRRASP